MTDVFIRRGRFTRRQESGHVTMQVETGVRLSQAQGTRRHQELEEAGRGPPSLRSDQGPTYTLIPDFWNPELFNAPRL